MSTKRPKTPKKVKTTRQCLLVLGMHRSGTSVVTQLLSIAGAKLPDDLLGANPGNEFGHFEPKWMIERDDRLLQDLGNSWDEWSRIDLDAAPREVVRAYVADLGNFVARERGDAALIVLKEPRICRILPLVLQALAAEKTEPLIVIPYRNPLEVAGSLQARDKMSPREGVLLWLRHRRHPLWIGRGERALFRPDLALVRVSWQMFVSPTGWGWRPLLGLWRWSAAPLRHAMRAALAIGVGYALSQLLPWREHAYWIVLTIVVVLRGSLAQTLERRNERVAGTLLGCMLASIVLLANLDRKSVV